MLLILRPVWAIYPIFILLYQNALCQSSDFHARYSTTYGPVFAATQQVSTHDSGTVFVGFQNIVYSQETSGLMVMKIDHYGNSLWAKAITTGGMMGYSNPTVCELPDGSIVVAVNPRYNNNGVYSSNILLTKLNCQGQVMWSNSIGLHGTSNTDYPAPMSVKPGANGDILLTFYNSSTANPYSAVSRIDGGGNIVWSKTLYGAVVGANVSDHYSTVAFYDNNSSSVMIFGLHNFYQNALNYSRQVYAVKLNYANGAVITNQGYNYNEFATGFGVLVGSDRSAFYAEQLTDGTYALFGIFSNFSQTTFYLYRIIINPDLSVNQSQAFAVPYSIGEPSVVISVLPNGETHISSPDYNDNTFYWYAADKANHVIRQVAIPYPGIEMNGGVGLGYIYQTGPTQSEYVVNLYQPANNGWYLDVTQASDEGNAIASCLGSPYSFVSPLSLTVTAGPWSWASTGTNEVVAATQAYSSADMPISQTFLCAPEAPVTNFKISGSSVVCATGDSYTYQVNPGDANKPVQWSIDPSVYERLTTINDSTISIVFKRVAGGPTEGKLYAKGGVCAPVEDSMTIIIDPGAELPRYATICTSPITLHPGYWFASYLWQDGSTDSVYTISKAGRYILKLETHCGGTITDTVDVYDNRIGGFDPVTICEHDTAVLQAPGGLVDYQWGPDYQLTVINDTAVAVYPLVDTAYILHTVTTGGCRLSDTLVVHVKPPLVVHLGGDTVICQQDRLVLNAGAGYKSYAWSTGSDSAAITVGPGTYSVLVVDAYGCKGGDTIVIEGNYCVAVLAVPSAFSPDGNGVNDIFKPHIEGVLDAYFFAVYNRWGEMVFSTHDPVNGWDGRYGGIMQSPGAYAWICEYKFAGQGRKVAKGTVVLVR